MKITSPNHALQRTRHDAVVYSLCVPRAESLSLGLLGVSMRYVALAFALIVATAFASEDGKVLTNEITGNRQLRLTGAQISITRGQFLEATFIVVGSTNTVGIRFPAHSYTPHETTLMTVVESCIDWTTPADPYQWHKARNEAVFSAPTNSAGYVTDFSRWFLVSLNTTNGAEK
jgi:hypothetical protein